MLHVCGCARKLCTSWLCGNLRGTREQLQRARTQVLGMRSERRRAGSLVGGRASPLGSIVDRSRRCCYRPSRHGHVEEAVGSPGGWGQHSRVPTTGQVGCPQHQWSYILGIGGPGAAVVRDCSIDMPGES